MDPALKAQHLILPPAQAMEGFFEKVIAMVQAHQWITSTYAIGPHLVRLHIGGTQLHDFMSEALMHVKVESPDAEQNLTVYAIDERALELTTPDAPWSWHTGDREGYIHGVDVDRFTIHFDHATQSLRCLDRQRNVAVHWMRDLSLIPYWERSFPLREIVNWWCRDTSLQPIHAAAVGIDGDGVLIGARGGSGKSSTALGCLRAGMQFAGDDFILADCQDLKAYSLYNIAKLDPQALARFPELTPPPGTRMIDQDKFQISLARIYPARLQRVLNLKMVLVPQITYSTKTTLAPISSEEATSALMLSTFYLLKGDTRAPFAKIKQLTSALPTYRLDLGLDFDHIPEVIANAIRNA